MPYTVLNTDLFQNLLNAEWARVRQVRTLLRSLQRCDYSVVESRRESHRALNDFRDNMLWGDQFFATDARFPDAPTDVFITTNNSPTAALLVSLSQVLSWRATNVAKDIEVAAPGRGQGQGPPNPTPEQGAQDNTKRFEELVKSLSDLCNSDAALWRRPSFEQRINATWA